MNKTFDQIVLRPVVSEKSYAAMAVGRYVFRCHPSATKIDIRTVVEVNTINVRGKTRMRSRGRTRVSGRSAGWKKAVVTLAPGQKIEGLFEGV
jgi:large subunit ribosomal protein L23